MDASGGLCVQACAGHKQVCEAGCGDILTKVHGFPRPYKNWLTAFTPGGDLQSTLFLLCPDLLQRYLFTANLAIMAAPRAQPPACGSQSFLISTSQLRGPCRDTSPCWVLVSLTPLNQRSLVYLGGGHSFLGLLLGVATVSSELGNGQHAESTLHYL